MLNLVNEIKSGLDCQLDYILNNSDFSTSYDCLAIDQLVYNNVKFEQIIRIENDLIEWREANKVVK